MHRGKFADCNFLGRRAYFPRHWTPRAPPPSPTPCSTFHDPSVRQKWTKRERERNAFGSHVYSGKTTQEKEKKKKKTNLGEAYRISTKWNSLRVAEWMTPFQSYPVMPFRRFKFALSAEIILLSFFSFFFFASLLWNKNSKILVIRELLPETGEEICTWVVNRFGRTIPRIPSLGESDGGNAARYSGVEIDLVPRVVGKGRENCETD